jgi:hypothetical protein
MSAGAIPRTSAQAAAFAGSAWRNATIAGPSQLALFSVPP